MQTTDSDLLFQTDAQVNEGATRERKALAAEGVGRPIQVTGKILDFVIHGSDAFVAESGWQARRIALDSGKTLRLYKGHTGPVTSVAPLILQSLNNAPLDLLFTSSWDKTIRVWDIATGVLLHTLIGHTDFVKSIIIIPHSRTPRLLSTSSDRTLRLWDLAPLRRGAIPECLQIVKKHTRPVDCAVAMMESGDHHDKVYVWTGDSMGVICKWKAGDTGLTFVDKLPGHETSITGLVLSDEGLWSVSMDKWAIHHTHGAGRRIVIPHPSYIHSILPVKDSSRNFILTGCDDEDLRLWQIDDEGDHSLVSQIQGHCGAISAMQNWADVIVTGSLDGTLRRWTKRDLLEPRPLNYDRKPAGQEVIISEEEERELAELMGE